MTIKQYGGVFGRNPTFNDVTVEGDLTVDGAVIHTGDLTVDNLNLSGNTISSTDTNGNIILDPNGTGYVFVAAPTNGTIAKLGDESSRTFFVKQANVGGYDNDTLIIESDSGVGQFQWKNGGGERLRINTGGDVSLLTGNLVIGTSGKGIDFSATAGTGTSELLDDYEEGTFTPVFIGSTTAGSQTYTTQAGFYEKIGRSVNFRFRLTINAKGTIAGNIIVGGLPFTTSSTASSYSNAFLGHAANLAITAGTNVTALLNLGADTMNLKVWSATTGTADITDANLTNTSQIFVTGNYSV